MKILSQILLVVIGLSGCSVRDNGTKKIVARYRVLDEVMSPHHVNCDSESKLFKQMRSTDCSFIVDSNEFDIIEKFVLDDKGKLKEYWTYKSEGPLTYTVEDLMNDEKLKELIKNDRLRIQLLGTSKIIDTGDTLIVDRIIDNVVFVKQDQREAGKHIRYLYEIN
jgi:hypothetical protein